MRLWMTSFFLFSALAAEEEYQINLKDPTFSHGTISTDQGGVISSSNIRIQARKIEYTNRVENGILVKKVSAEGDLLLEHEGRAFVGRKLDYDFVEKTGILLEGRTSTDYWFVGGEEIELHPDGSFSITDAYLTTVESLDPWWEIRSSKIGISDSDILSAKNIKFKFFKTPLFWLPSFKLNLKLFKDSPIRYRFIWDQILKQKISMRYEVYSTENLTIFGRFDYRFKIGPGAAIETDYHTTDERTTFQTKSYGAFDKIIPEERGNKRFRLQGIFDTQTENDQTQVHMAYDLLSDDKMPQDFKSDDFELNTQKRTILWVRHTQDNFFSRFNLQPRINRFQSINQQLPYITTGIRPFQLGSSGIIADNWMSAGYLDYVFAKALQGKLRNAAAARLETNNFLYRPFSMGPLNLTPGIGFTGIFYSNNRDRHATGQALFTYKFEANTRLHRTYASLKHTVEPYALFQGNSHPTSATDQHFVFNLDDGVAPLNLLRMGLRQAFFSTRHHRFLPNLAFDLYTYGFFGNTVFHRTFPKAYLSCDLLRPSVALHSSIAYNLQETLFDFCNVRTDWTASENFAIGVEFRHRSRYDWRKADRDNFVMEIERPISELFHSTISDGRNTLLGRFQLRFSPLWTGHFESHFGWGRKDEPRYNAFELKFSTFITGKWLLEFGYKFAPDDKTWTGPSIKLMR